MKKITACVMAIAVAFVANAGLFDSLKEAANKTLDAAGKVTETTVSTVGNVVQEGASALQGQQVNVESSGTVARKTEETAENSPNVSTSSNVPGESEEQQALKKSLAYLSGDFKRQMDELMAMDDENRYRESVKYFYSRVRPRFATKWQRYRVSENPGVPLLLYDEDSVPSTLSEVDRWIAAHEANLAEERHHFSRGKASATAIRSAGGVQAAERPREVDTAAIKNAHSEKIRAVAGTTAKQSGSEKNQALEKAMSYLSGDFKRQMDELMGMDRNGRRYQKSVRQFYMNFIEPGTHKGVGAMQWYTASEHEGVPVLINGDAKAPATLAGVEKWIANHERQLQEEYKYFEMLSKRNAAVAKRKSDFKDKVLHKPLSESEVISPSDEKAFAAEAEWSYEYVSRNYTSRFPELFKKGQEVVKLVYGIEGPEQLKGSTGTYISFQNYVLVDNTPLGTAWKKVPENEDFFEAAYRLDAIYGFITNCPQQLMWQVGSHGEEKRNFTTAKLKDLIDAEFSSDHIQMKYGDESLYRNNVYPVSKVAAAKLVLHLKKRDIATEKMLTNLEVGYREGQKNGDENMSVKRYAYCRDVLKNDFDKSMLEEALSQFVFYKGLSFGKCYYSMLPLCESMANSKIKVRKDADLFEFFKRKWETWPKLKVDISLQVPTWVGDISAGKFDVFTDRVEPDLRIPTAHRIEIQDDVRTLRMAFGAFGNDRSQSPLAAARLDFNKKPYPSVKQVVEKYRKMMGGDVKMNKRPLEIATEENIAMAKKELRRLYAAAVKENGAPEGVNSNPDDLKIIVNGYASFQTELSNGIVTCIICSREDSDESEVAVIYFFDQIIYEGLKAERKRLVAEDDAKMKSLTAEKEKKAAEKSLDF